MFFNGFKTFFNFNELKLGNLTFGLNFLNTLLLVLKS